jgi:hypothetical protein
MKHNLNLQPADGGRFGRSLRWMGWLCRLVRNATSAACLLVIAAGLFSAVKVRAADDDMPLDYQVKAAFLVNFPKYVDWPASVFTETNSPITVGIFGDDNVAAEFGNMIEGGRSVGGRPILLKHINKEEQIGTDCQILFIASSERLRVPAILEKVKGTGVLTVGESEDFLEKGGIINLVHRDRKIRLKVNLGAAGKERLKISSRLLIAADVVKGKSD